MDSAEQIALTPQSDNGQTAKYFNAKRLNIFGHDGKPADGSREMMLTANPHFDHLPVNTTFSSVLMPTNVPESDPDVINSIQWSEHLDPLFVNNYEDDPSLSWQYFGNSSGYLRRYPPIAWPPEEMSSVWQRSSEDRNVYDFQSTAWYVTAATSPKDIVILVDSTTAGSGKNLAIADAIISAILDTLTNDDYVNVFKFSDIAEETVRCFQDALMQANNENKRWLRESIKTLRPGDATKQDFTPALVKGFEILHKYNRTGQGCHCNQAIMLITIGASSKYKELFKNYNWPHKPVMIFTYLVGTESNGVDDLHWIACGNKGYYIIVGKPDEAKQQVLRYIEVMARTVVMYQNDHPIQWTSAYVGFFLHFNQNNVRAIDETWYKRAVDQHSVEPESFVFSVPFDIGATAKSLVTATLAVFVEQDIGPLQLWLGCSINIARWLAIFGVPDLLLVEKHACLRGLRDSIYIDLKTYWVNLTSIFSRCIFEWSTVHIGLWINRLNTSGLRNPLKSKFTNHVVGDWLRELRLRLGQDSKCLDSIWGICRKNGS